MLCEKCGKNEANTLIRESVNGQVREVRLCAECASELGYNNMLLNFNPFGGMALNMQNILGSLFAQSLPENTTSTGRQCSNCGMTFEELAQSAMAGCPQCYREFSQELRPSIQRIHGKTRHTGKLPGTAGEELKLKRELEDLKRQLSDAVNTQEYEKAAVIRDQIKELEKKVK